MWFSRHKTLVTAGVVGLSALLLIFVALLPIYQNTTDLLAKIKTTTATRDDLANKVAVASKLDPAATAARVAVLDAALPPRKDIILYLSAVDGLSRELGLTFGGISLSPGELATNSAQTGVKLPTGLQTLETDIKMRGSQDSIYSFLRTIEQVLPLMQIKDIKVSIIPPDQYALSVTLGMLWAPPTTVNAKGNVTLFTTDEEKYFTDLQQYRQFTAVGSTAPADITGNGKQDLFQPIATETTNTSVSTNSAKLQP